MTKWYESEPGVQSSDRIMRMIVVVVVCVVIVGYAFCGMDKFLTSGGVMPNFDALGTALAKFVGTMLVGIGFWKGVASATEKFDDNKKE